MDPVLAPPEDKRTKYERHIASHRWKGCVARVAEILASGNACRLCSTQGTPDEPLHGHHRTYANFGNELLGDVTALCPRCHDGVTSMLRARKYAAQPPILSEPATTTSNRAPLFDESFARGVP
jgi:hypothetical protein